MSRRLRTLASIVAACVALTITLQAQTVYRLRFVSASASGFNFQAGFAAGTVASTHGSSFTFTGTSFGTKSAQTPTKYDDFQSVTTSSQISTSSAAGPAWVNDTQRFNPVACA